MTLDDSPPKLIYPDDYVFVVIAQPDRTFQVYQSRHYVIGATEVAQRLRNMADSIELSAPE